MAKFENVRVYNFENAVRALHNATYSWADSDSEFGLCYNNELYKIINKKLNMYHIENNDTNSILEYRNVVLWNYGDYVEYGIIGPKDMELAKTDEWFLENLGVSYDIVKDEKVTTVFAKYSELYDAYYHEPSEDFKRMIEQLPYAYDLIMNS